MKRFAWTLVLVLLMAGFVFAQDTATEETKEIAPGLSTYAGIAVLTTMVIGFAKKMWPKFVKGKEPFFAIGLPVILGVIGKLAGAGFSEIDWVTHIIALALSGVGSNLIHDKLVNPLIKDKGNGGGNPT